MIARISADDIVLYANSAMAAYLRAEKSDLAGAPLEVLAARTRGEISSCFQRPESGRSSNRLVTDADGRVFEVKTYSEAGVLDIVLDEVTTADSVNRDLQAVSGTPVEALNEEELRTARQPERRFMTVSHTRLNEAAHLAERLAPMETRLMLNSFAEEAADAILETGCTYYQSSADSVIGLFGAPRYFADHALRAVRAACNQVEKSVRLREGFFRQGKEMPPMSCGISTGETFVGTLGSSATQHYSAIGVTVDLASELCRLARAGEILISEMSLRNIIQTLPEGWQAIRAESESEPDLNDFQWTGEEIQPLPEEDVRGVWLIGPGIEDDSSRAEFYADYLYALKIPGLDEPMPVLRVVRPSLVGDSLELSAANVVGTPFLQMLGKYKLIKVIGTGGMGKVWKAQDRYGNLVAIKVLHTSETTTDPQLKRFQREAEVMSRLPHRNICRIFEMSEFEAIHFIVMEFVDGLTLADLLYERTRAESSHDAARALPDLKSLIHTLREERDSRDDSPPPDELPAVPRPKKTRILPVEQTLTMFLKICEAVQFAHEHGVLHRDLKPGNILLREDGEPLVADFGLAKLSGGDAAQSLSVSGHVVGTMENMSPEQAESSKEVDERADVYALGTILFQMLTGHRHFEATGNIVADAQALQTHESPRPRSLNPKLDADLEVILLKALRHAPEERYRSVAALSSDLEHFRRGEPITARPVSAIDLVRKLVLRNRAVTAVITASILLLTAGSVVAFWKITERAKVAENALAEAKEQKQVAEDALKEAKKQQEIALANQDIAKAKSAEAKAAAKQILVAAEKLDSAKSETEQEKQKRMEAEAAADRLKGADQKLTETQAKLEALRTAKAQPRRPDGPPPWRQQQPPEDEQAFQKAMRAAQEAMFQFHNEFQSGRLSLSERRPEAILERITDGLRPVSEAVLASPDCAPAWLMIGRYHLACMEIPQAKQAFAAASKAAAARDADGRPTILSPDDNPSELEALCDQVQKSTGDRFQNAAQLVGERSSPTDQVTAGIIEFFRSSKLKKSAFGPSPFERTPGRAEVALELIAANGGTGKVGGESGEVAISGIANLTDLSAMRRLDPLPTHVRIQDATALDWTNLAALPLESLDLSGSPLNRMPTASFQKLQTLVLKDTAFTELSCVLRMPQLVKLDISRSYITDLAPLAISRRLQSLDAGGLALRNLRTLAFLPLVRLTISPLQIPDKAELNGLKSLRLVRVLRAPGDPEDQTPAAFWKKLADGGYATDKP